MKNTLRLFQLLLAVFGFYAAIQYSGNSKNIISLACIGLIIILDRCDTIITRKDEDHEQQKTQAKTTVDQSKKSKKQLECILHSRNVTVVIDTIQELLRELGMSVKPSLNHPAVNRLLELPDQQGYLGLKIIQDVDEPNADWDQWHKIMEFEEEDDGRHRLLLIAPNQINDLQASTQTYRNFSGRTIKLLVDRRITAMTTLSFCHLYQLCKEKNQDPHKIFLSIYQHPGGVFEL